MTELTQRQVATAERAGVEHGGYYHLGVEQEPGSPTTLTITTHLDALKLASVRRQHRDNSWHGLEARSFRGYFIGGSDRVVFGYGGVAHIEDAPEFPDGFLRLKIPLPETDGSDPEYKQLIPISATIQDTIHALQFLHDSKDAFLPSDTKIRQYTRVAMKTRKTEYRSAGLEVRLTPPLLGWLETQDNWRLAGLEDKTRQVMKRTMDDTGSSFSTEGSEQEDNNSTCQAILRGGGIRLVTLGVKKPSLYSKSRPWEQPEEDGVFIRSSKVETLAQQLSLLAGIAYLGNTAMKASAK